MKVWRIGRRCMCMGVADARTLARPAEVTDLQAPHLTSLRPIDVTAADFQDISHHLHHR
jgi:hypothetical protein